MALNNLELLDKFREVINLEIIESQSDIKRLSKDFYNYSPILTEKLDECIADLVVRPYAVSYTHLTLPTTPYV